MHPGKPGLVLTRPSEAYAQLETGLARAQECSPTSGRMTAAKPMGMLGPCKVCEPLGGPLKE